MKKIRRRYVLLLLLSLVGYIYPLMSQANLKVANSDIAGFVDYLLCDFNVDMTEAQLTAVLDALIAEEETDCNPVEAELKTMTSTTASFQWPNVPGAVSYTVASIGLSDGVTTQSVINTNGITFTGLTNQEYLFIFITNCLEGSSVADILIIDMDVYYPNSNFSFMSQCRCKNLPMALPTNPNCPTFPDATTFPWANNCDANKYHYSITSNSGYEADIWVLNNEVTSQVNISPFDCSDFTVETFDGSQFYVADPENFEIIFTTVGAHAYLWNSSLTMTAHRCDCYNNLVMGKVAQLEERIVEENITILPNPFSESLSINAGVQNNGQATISLIGLDGKLMSTETIDVYKGNNKIEINTEHLPAGVYSLLFESNGQRTMERVVKI